jgi:SAM-dependent methyltransferase
MLPASKSGSRKVEKRPARETNPAVLRQAMLRRLRRRTSASGRVRLPAVPALIDHYVTTLAILFASVGRPFDDEELATLRGILEPQLKEGFEASPYAHVIVRYETDPPPAVVLSYRFSLEVSTMKDEYDQWVETRTPPLFGAHPDAKVMALARSLGPPSDVPVLDIGAGSGRNALPLAREGFPIDGVEVTPSLAAILRAEASRAGVAVRVFEGDVLDAALDIPREHYRLIVLAEVFAHIRGVRPLRAWFERLAGLLAPGGLLVFSVFLTGDGYQPDRLNRELSEVFWCTLFTRRELAEGSAGLRLALVSDESVPDYERRHLPPEAWPPTGWFEEWTRGQDLYDLPAVKAPCEMRWLVYRRL